MSSTIPIYVGIGESEGKWFAISELFGDRRFSPVLSSEEEANQYLTDALEGMNAQLRIVGSELEVLPLPELTP